MTAINFPTTPSIGQTYSYSGRTWVWNGTAWDFIGVTGPAGPAGAAGSAATVSIGATTTGAAGSPAAVTNSGTSNAAVLNFSIPQGAQGSQGPAGAAGSAATVSVGTVSTGAAGSSATVTNAGTSSAAVLNFLIPRGDTGATGATGSAGAAATISIGTITTGAAGSSASVTNSGTSAAAVLDFSIPKGDTGSPAGLFAGQFTTPPNLSNWTQHNIAGSASVSDTSLGPIIKDTFSTGMKIRGLYITAPTAPYTIDALISGNIPDLNWSGVGLYFTDGTKLQTFLYGSGGGNNLRLPNYSTANAYASTATTDQMWRLNSSALWMRVRDDGTTIYYYHSSDGINWSLRYSVAKSAGYLGATGYSKVGFFLCSEAQYAPGGTAMICSATLLSWKVT